MPPCGYQTDGGGNDQYANSQSTGNTDGLSAFGSESGHVRLHKGRGGIINTGTGQQGKNGNDQIRDGGVFPDPCHGLRKGSGYQCSNEACKDHTVNAKKAQSVSTPGKGTTGGANNAAKAVNIEQDTKADAANKSC